MNKGTSLFGFQSTAAEVAAQNDLTGKTVIVTGDYSSGIGLETSKVLSSARATAVVPARSICKSK